MRRVWYVNCVSTKQWTYPQRVTRNVPPPQRWGAPTPRATYSRGEPRCTASRAPAPRTAVTAAGTRWSWRGPRRPPPAGPAARRPSSSAPGPPGRTPVKDRHTVPAHGRRAQAPTHSSNEPAREPPAEDKERQNAAPGRDKSRQLRKSADTCGELWFLVPWPSESTSGQLPEGIQNTRWTRHLRPCVHCGPRHDVRHTEAARAPVAGRSDTGRWRL